LSYPHRYPVINLREEASSEIAGRRPRKVVAMRHATRTEVATAVCWTGSVVCVALIAAKAISDHMPAGHIPHGHVVQHDILSDVPLIASTDSPPTVTVRAHPPAYSQEDIETARDILHHRLTPAEAAIYADIKRITHDESLVRDLVSVYNITGVPIEDMLAVIIAETSGRHSKFDNGAAQSAMQVTELAMPGLLGHYGHKVAGQMAAYADRIKDETQARHMRAVAEELRTVAAHTHSTDGLHYTVAPAFKTRAQALHKNWMVVMALQATSNQHDVDGFIDRHPDCHQLFGNNVGRVINYLGMGAAEKLLIAHRHNPHAPVTHEVMAPDVADRNHAYTVVTKTVVQHHHGRVIKHTVQVKQYYTVHEMVERQIKPYARAMEAIEMSIERIKAEHVLAATQHKKPLLHFGR